MPAGYFRNTALNLVARQWANRDSESAAAWAAALPNDDPSSSNRSRNEIPFRADPLMTVMSAWMDRDPDAAKHWIEQLPDETRRNDLPSAIVSLTGDEDPRRAAQLLTDLIPPGERQDKALVNLTFRWGHSDPRGALAWAVGQTEAHVREIIVPVLARDFSEFQNLDPQDTQTALHLAQSLNGNAQQSAIQSVLRTWAANDPAAAATWAAPYSSNAGYLTSVAFAWVQKRSGNCDPMGGLVASGSGER